MPSSGAMVFTATGPEGREAGPFQHDCRLALGQVRTICEDVGGKDAGSLRQCAEFPDQIFGRSVAMHLDPRIFLVGNYNIPHEGFYAVSDQVSTLGHWRLLGSSFR